MFEQESNRMVTEKLAMQKPNVKRLNLKARPYRGVIKEIANELGENYQNVKQGILRRSPKYIEIFERKIRERQQIARRYEALLCDEQQ
jgi:hypothetical protein